MQYKHFNDFYLEPLSHVLLIMKSFLFLVLTLAALHLQAQQSHSVIFGIYPYWDVSDQDIQRTADGTLHFAELVKRNCGLEIKPQIKTQQLRADTPQFVFLGSFLERSFGDLGSYFFRFFQEDTFKEIQKHTIRSEKNEVSFLLMKTVGSHCGFAFPEIQFNDLEASAKNQNLNLKKSIESLLVNKVLFAAPTQNGPDCANSDRMVSHELAHIFIQDERPHHCLNLKTQSYEPCPASNLLATQQITYPDRGGFGDRRFKPGFGEDPILGPDDRIYINATGTDITPDQCRAIEATLLKMQK